MTKLPKLPNPASVLEAKYTAEQMRKYARKAIEQAQQEPVAYTGNGTAGREADVRPTGFFFQMPPQRQPLTDEQIEACLHHVDEDGIGLFDFARAIEAKLKEKNT